MIQKVEHCTANTYPVIADPLFKRGVITRVLKEKWSSNGGHEISFKISPLVRYQWIRVSNRKSINIKGPTDLQEHYPRSMNKAAMHQQWRCHIYGCNQACRQLEGRGFHKRNTAPLGMTDEREADRATLIANNMAMDAPILVRQEFVKTFLQAKKMSKYVQGLFAWTPRLDEAEL